MTLDKMVSSEEYALDTGTTICVVLITDTQIYCANSGDSRGVLSNSSKANPLSFDHKPYNDDEMKRIRAANHYVQMDRVDGNLALSRAIGDFNFKDQEEMAPEDQAVTAFPDITCRQRDSNDEFIILACDGIWDCLENQACVDKLKDYMDKLEKEQKGNSEQWLEVPVEKMLDDILAKSTADGEGTDNMTAILIKFKQ